jgi:hypothetical protein
VVENGKRSGTTMNAHGDPKTRELLKFINWQIRRRVNEEGKTGTRRIRKVKHTIQIWM